MHFVSIVVFLCLIFSTELLAKENLEVSHYQAHSRYAYGAQLLDLALSKLNTLYQVKAITPNNDMLNEARGELEVIAGNIDVEWMSTNVDRETKMIPIKIPLYQGMLGLRLLLVNPLQHQTMSKLSSLHKLQELTGGHGLHWADLSVYAANELKVLPHKNYDSIFELLKLGRIDYFHRGLNEIWDEVSSHANTINGPLKIADNVMLYYPLPVYFFVSKQRPELAKHIEQGIKLSLNDGSFKALFEKAMGDYVSKGKLNTRKLILLKNPDLPINTPFIETNWWLPEKFDAQMKAKFSK